jgi:hypothetical protein
MSCTRERNSINADAGPSRCSTNRQAHSSFEEIEFLDRDRSVRIVKPHCPDDARPQQTRRLVGFLDSEAILPAAMAGGNAGLVLCQVGGQCSGQ